MPQWIEKIELGEVLRKVNEEFDLSRVEERCPVPVKKQLIAVIEKSSKLRHFADAIHKARSIAALNRLIEEIYNEADRVRVWCGL